MIETCSGRLNPLQSPSLHDFRPHDRHLRVAAEDVRLQQLRGNPLLPRIDDFVPRCSRPNLLQMPRLNWVTKHDSHSDNSRVALTKGTFPIRVATRGVAERMGRIMRTNEPD